jgi:hypothetical protein
MKNFAITGMGRSGTTFLSQLMNRSEVWTVLHEPGIQRKAPIEKVQPRFQKDFYGEVNSYLMNVFKDLEVEKKAILIRHPHDVFLSAYNRRPKFKCETVVPFMKEHYTILDSYLEEGIKMIRFEKMTTDIVYLQSLLDDFEINDVEICQEDLDIKINTNKEYHCDNFEDIDTKCKESFLKEVNWFADKYYDVFSNTAK